DMALDDWCSMRHTPFLRIQDVVSMERITKSDQSSGIPRTCCPHEFVRRLEAWPSLAGAGTWPRNGEDPGLTGPPCLQFRVSCRDRLVTRTTRTSRRR